MFSKYIRQTFVTSLVFLVGGVALADDDKLEQGLRRVARQSAQTEIGKRPEVTVVISRLTE